MPKISVDARKVVITERGHGSGYISGRCVICGSSGGLNKYRYGLPHSHDQRATATPSEAYALIHKSECPMNRVLTPTGKMRSESFGHSIMAAVDQLLSIPENKMEARAELLTKFRGQCPPDRYKDICRAYRLMMTLIQEAKERRVKANNRIK